MKIIRIGMNRSKKALMSKIYSTQKNSCNIRNASCYPVYTKEELYTWAIGIKLFHKLYDAWVDSNYTTLLIPSVDRKRDDMPYTLDNIQIMSWGDNRAKGYRDRSDGTDTRTNKAVIQYTKEMEFIRDYHSMQEAARVTKIPQSNISTVCNGHRRTAGGFIWKIDTY